MRKPDIEKVYKVLSADEKQRIASEAKRAATNRRWARQLALAREEMARVAAAQEEMAGASNAVKLHMASAGSGPLKTPAPRSEPPLDAKTLEARRKMAEGAARRWQRVFDESPAGQALARAKAKNARQP